MEGILLQASMYLGAAVLIVPLAVRLGLGSVLGYLDEIDPATAKVARQRYGCLTPWQADPQVYGRAALTDFDAFFKDLGGTPKYRWRARDFRFFESVSAATGVITIDVGLTSSKPSSSTSLSLDFRLISASLRS